MSVLVTPVIRDGDVQHVDCKTCGQRGTFPYEGAGVCESTSRWVQLHFLLHGPWKTNPDGLCLKCGSDSQQPILHAETCPFRAAYEWEASGAPFEMWLARYI